MCFRAQRRATPPAPSTTKSAALRPASFAPALCARNATRTNDRAVFSSREHTDSTSATTDRNEAFFAFFRPGTSQQRRVVAAPTARRPASHQPAPPQHRPLLRAAARQYYARGPASRAGAATPHCRRPRQRRNTTKQHSATMWYPLFVSFVLCCVAGLRGGPHQLKPRERMTPAPRREEKERRTAHPARAECSSANGRDRHVIRAESKITALLFLSDADLSRKPVKHSTEGKQLNGGPTGGARDD